MTTFATGLNFPYGMAALADGSVLVATSAPPAGGAAYFAAPGQLVRLADADRDGVADGPGAVLYSGLPGPATDVRTAGNLAVVTSTGNPSTLTVLRAGPTPAAPYSRAGAIVLTFPAGWEHQSYALAVRPTPARAGLFDVFFNVGSSGNDTQSADAVNLTVDGLGGLAPATVVGASIYKVTLTDAGAAVAVSDLTEVASGLRNAAGITFEPGTGDLLFVDNGIDGLTNPDEPESADELNRIPAAAVGGPVEDFGFPASWIEYRTGRTVGSGEIPPLVAYQPVPASSTNESEGPAEIAFAPPRFPAGLRNGVFGGFHGRFNLGGQANEENPLVYTDLSAPSYFHFIGNDEPNVGHLDGIVATQDSLLVADMSASGSLGADGDGQGVIYQVRANPSAAFTAPDFNGDSQADVAMFRPGSAGTWYSRPMGGGAVRALAYGTSGDIPLPGDYDGDRTTDEAVFRPSTGLWAAHNSMGGDTFVTYGGVPGDVPVPADYDGDGKTDIAIYRPSTGTWFVRPSSGAPDSSFVYGGLAGDLPVPADFDGDGRADPAIFRDGAWFVHASAGGTDFAMGYGAAADVPLLADFDGDGKADIAIYRPSTGLWAVHRSSDGADTAVTYGGIARDLPVATDYDGDGAADIAILRPSVAAWFVHRSTDGADEVTTFGLESDIPLAIPYAVRHRVEG